LFSFVYDLAVSKDHAVAVSVHDATPITKPDIHHLRGRNRQHRDTDPLT